MPEIQELKLQAPKMMNDYFHILIEGKSHQPWERSLYSGDDIVFYLEDEKRWITAKVASWYIDDGSGNAPGANANFFARWTDEKGTWRYTLHGNLLIKFEAPTKEELEKRSWCEGGDYYYVGPYNPDRYEPCGERGNEYIAPSGQHLWYCDVHNPGLNYQLIKSAANVEVK